MDFNTLHQQYFKEQTQSLIEIGSQREKGTATHNIESSWGKIMAVMGEKPAAMYSIAVLCGRSEDVKKRE